MCLNAPCISPPAHSVRHPLRGPMPQPPRNQPPVAPATSSARLQPQSKRPGLFVRVQRSAVTTHVLVAAGRSINSVAVSNKHELESSLTLALPRGLVITHNSIDEA